MSQKKREGTIRTLAVSIVSAAAVAAGVLLIRQRGEEVEANPENIVPAGETVPGTISLDRVRELGI